jgi:hypothetical protein
MLTEAPPSKRTRCAYCGVEKVPFDMLEWRYQRDLKLNLFAT